MADGHTNGVSVKSEPVQFDGVDELLGVSNGFTDAHDDLDAVEDRLERIRARQFALREPIWPVSAVPVTPAPTAKDVPNHSSAKSSDTDLAVHFDFSTFNEELLKLTGDDTVRSLDLR